MWMWRLSSLSARWVTAQDPGRRYVWLHVQLLLQKGMWHDACATIIIRFSLTTNQCNYNSCYKTTVPSKWPPEQIQVTQAASISTQVKRWRWYSVSLYTQQCFMVNLRVVECDEILVWKLSNLKDIELSNIDYLQIGSPHCVLPHK